MEPVRSNSQSKTCPEQISSNCVKSAVPAAPCLSICAGASQTDVDYAQNNAICGIISALSSLEPLPAPIIDLSAVNLGCIYQSTLIEWTCPVGQQFRPDSTAFPANGTPGFCETVSIPHTITLNTPVLTTTPNPIPPPTTLPGILNLLISYMCTKLACDPCNTPNIPTT